MQKTMTYSAGFTSPLGCDSKTGSWQIEELLMGCVAIKTERLCLREARMSDLDDLHAVWSNDDVMRYWYGV